MMVSSWLMLLLLFMAMIAIHESQMIQKLQDKIKKVASNNLGVNVARHDHEEMMLFSQCWFST